MEEAIAAAAEFVARLWAASGRSGSSPDRAVDRVGELDARLPSGSPVATALMRRAADSRKRYIAIGRGGASQPGRGTVPPTIPTRKAKSPRKPTAKRGAAEEIVIAIDGAPKSRSIRFCTSRGSRPASGARRIVSRRFSWSRRRSRRSTSRISSLDGVVALHAPDGVAVLPGSEAVTDRAVRRRDRVAHLVDAAVPLDGRARMLGPRQRALGPRRPGLVPRGHEDGAAVGRELDPVGAEGVERRGSGDAPA